MNLVEIPQINFSAEIPSHWDEMTHLQVDHCLKMAILASFGLITPIEAKVRCLYHLLDIQRDWKTEVWEKTQSQATVLEKNSKAVILAEQLCSFIFKETQEVRSKTQDATTALVNRTSSIVDQDSPNKTLEVCYNTLTNHFPQLHAGKTILNGPAAMLSDITFGEFRTAMIHMQTYFESKAKDQTALSRMIGCLYRPAPDDLYDRMKSNDWDGQTRIPFNPDRIGVYESHAAKLSIVHRNAILLWFTFCIDWIKKSDLVLNGMEVNFSILFNKPIEGGGQGLGWTGVLFSVSEKKIFGDADDVDRRNFLEVLLYLYDKELENIRLKTKLQSKKR